MSDGVILTITLVHYITLTFTLTGDLTEVNFEKTVIFLWFLLLDKHLNKKICYKNVPK